MYSVTSVQYTTERRDVLGCTYIYYIYIPDDQQNPDDH